MAENISVAAGFLVCTLLRLNFAALLRSMLFQLVGVSGEILLDGRPAPPNFQLISGYVVQDDVVMGTLTVRENLLFSANLRLPPSLTRVEKAAKVDEIIRQLG